MTPAATATSLCRRSGAFQWFAEVRAQAFVRSNLFETIVGQLPKPLSSHAEVPGQDFKSWQPEKLQSSPRLDGASQFQSGCVFCFFRRCGFWECLTQGGDSPQLRHHWRGGGDFGVFEAGWTVGTQIHGRECVQTFIHPEDRFTCSFRSRKPWFDVFATRCFLAGLNHGTKQVQGILPLQLAMGRLCLKVAGSRNCSFCFVTLLLKLNCN